MSSRPVVAVLTLALVGALAACGGGDDPLTKAEYIAAADEICQANVDAGEALEDPRTEADLVPYFEEAIEIFEGTVADFADLDPPEDGEEVQQAQLDALEEATATLTEARDLAAKGDVQGAVALLGEADPGAASEAAARDYGFEVCGSEDAEQ